MGNGAEIACALIMCNASLIFVHFIFYYRLSYAVYLMDSLQRRHDDSTELFVMNDIACSLQKHLKVCFLIYMHFPDQ